jgi:hypothetical protein
MRQAMGSPNCHGCSVASLAEGLALLGAVDAFEADAFGAGVVQNFDRIAVENGNDGAGEVGGTDNSWDK